MRGLMNRHPMVVSADSGAPRGKPRSALSWTTGARVIDSTPPASSRSASPERTARDAWLTASSPEAHRRFTVTPGTSTGSSASSAPMRATLRLSRPPGWRRRRHVLDLRAVDPVALHRGADHMGGEVVGVPGERAAIAADRGAEASMMSASVGGCRS